MLLPRRGHIGSFTSPTARNRSEYSLVCNNGWLSQHRNPRGRDRRLPCFEGKYCLSFALPSLHPSNEACQVSNRRRKLGLPVCVQILQTKHISDDYSETFALMRRWLQIEEEDRCWNLGINAGMPVFKLKFHFHFDSERDLFDQFFELEKTRWWPNKLRCLFHVTDSLTLLLTGTVETIQLCHINIADWLMEEIGQI